MRDALLPDLRHRLVRATELAADSAPATNLGRNQNALWEPAELAGRLCEICAGPQGVQLTIACSIIYDFQLLSEPTAWVTNCRDTFFPPDVERSGIDLAALPVVQVPDLHDAVTAAERLTRSGAFGLVLIELSTDRAVSTAVLGRLVRIARKHDTALVCLTASGAKLGSLVSIRGRGKRLATPQPGYFRCSIHVIKDRQRGPGRSLAATYHAPYGMH